MGASADRLGRGRKTRDRIVDGAEQVFSVGGYHEATIVDITRAAGVALGTFYVHFESKRAIYEELVRQRGTDLRDAIRESTHALTGRAEREIAGFRAYFDWIAEHPGIYRIVRRAWSDEPELVADWYEALATSYALALGEHLGAGSKLNPEVLAYSLMGAADFVAKRYILAEGVPLSAERFDAFMQVVFQMLGIAALAPAAPRAI